MLEELLKAYPEGIPETFNGIRLKRRKVAKLSRDEDCHAVYFHPLKEHFFFASKLHKEVAEAQLGNPRLGILTRWLRLLKRILGL